MRISRFGSILTASIFAIVALPVPAQVLATDGGVIGAVITGGGPFTQGAGVSKQPYTVTWTQKQVQTLANGTTITHEYTTRFAMDSSGRSYNETHNTQPVGVDGQSREMVSYRVSDPVAHTSTMWNSNERRATVVHEREPETIAARPVPPVQATLSQEIVAQPKAVRTQPDVQYEELGTKNIAGVNAKGTRITRTIPAGREGNDQPLTIIEETWRSSEYGLVMMSMRNDPRYGTTTRELTEFQAGEPDAALFHAPEGYTVQDIPARTVTIPNQ